MTTWVDAIRTFSLASLSLAAGACAVPAEASEEIEEVAEADGALIAEHRAELEAQLKLPHTCVMIRRGGLGDRTVGGDAHQAAPATRRVRRRGSGLDAGS